ncbi:siderophore-interacting protein [Rhodococcus sp. SJ-3]|uniref:siderophore-interacting protein n=1 Tax=Rhodococcus sp. SJ-3 TaxID=3454628 RepID=UPI003F792B5F
MAEKSRGWQGAVLKLLRADDYELTVTSRTEITEHYLRIGFTDGGLLADHPVHPTMWIRMWFPDGDKVHQRGYTLVDIDVDKGTFDIDFAIHDGSAARWAQTVTPGEKIGATVMGSKFEVPEVTPAGYLIAGDIASLPAINSLLASIGDVPATVWIEWVHERDRTLPLAAGSNVTVKWIQRANEGKSLADAVKAEAFHARDHFGWVAAEAKWTRAIAAAFKGEFEIPKKQIKSQAYWM